MSKKKREKLTGPPIKSIEIPIDVEEYKINQLQDISEILYTKLQFEAEINQQASEKLNKLEWYIKISQFRLSDAIFKILCAQVSEEYGNINNFMALLHSSRNRIQIIDKFKNIAFNQKCVYSFESSTNVQLNETFDRLMKLVNSLNNDFNNKMVEKAWERWHKMISAAETGTKIRESEKLCYGRRLKMLSKPMMKLRELDLERDICYVDKHRDWYGSWYQYVRTLHSYEYQDLTSQFSIAKIENIAAIATFKRKIRECLVEELKLQKEVEKKYHVMTVLQRFVYSAKKLVLKHEAHYHSVTDNLNMEVAKAQSAQIQQVMIQLAVIQRTIQEAEIFDVVKQVDQVIAKYLDKLFQIFFLKLTTMEQKQSKLRKIVEELKVIANRLKDNWCSSKPKANIYRVEPPRCILMKPDVDQFIASILTKSELKKCVNVT